MSFTLAQLQSALSEPEDKPAKGYKTTEDWAAEWGKSVSHTSKLIRAAVKRGAMVARLYRRKAGQRLMPVPHYGRKG